MASDGSKNLEERPIATTAKDGGAPPFDVIADALSEPALAAAQPAGRMSWLLAAASRYGYPVALAVAVILFLFWPRNAGSEHKWDAGTDDLLFLALVAYLARQVAKRSPTLLDLPSAVTRAVRRGLRLDG